ncbi:MAG: hypothetical protein DLM68_07265 [Hyphomicrobiales bacterium]|nr:MAG: hypothetical protein DLM68_07265 [Hyphomicrobiales bacterium]
MKGFDEPLSARPERRIMAAREIAVNKYVVRLSRCECSLLETLIRKGSIPARRLLRARILLKAEVSEAGEGWSSNQIIGAPTTSAAKIYRVRKQRVADGVAAVLSCAPRLAFPGFSRAGRKPRLICS